MVLSTDMIFKIFKTYDIKYNMKLVDGFKENIETFYEDWSKLETEINMAIGEDRFTEFSSYSKKLQE